MDLDVSMNTALVFLYCGNNLLSSLDVSANINLSELECFDNLMEAPALNSLFNSLCTTNEGYIIIGGNDGAASCTRKIAEDKGWEVLDEW